MSDTAFTQSAGKWFIDKDPDAVLDYTVDFTKWLDSMTDTIITKSTTASGCVVNSSAIVGKKVVVWVSGGTVGMPASVTVEVTTAGGRTDDRTINFKIKER